MRRLSPVLALAAFSLILFAIPDDAAAAGRGHGFSGKGSRAHFAGRHHGFRQHGRFGDWAPHGRHHGGKLGRGTLIGGFWPGGYDGFGAPPLAVQQNVMTNVASHPMVPDMPGSTGIRSEAAAQPVIYVIKGSERRPNAALVRKSARERLGMEVLASNPGREVERTGSISASGPGPRIVEVKGRAGRP
jgi:hypothetical protein